MTAYRRVGPFNFCRGAVAEIDRFQLRVEHITVRRFDLTEIVAAISQSVVGVNVAVLIGHIFSDGIMITVIQQKHSAINTLAGILVYLVQ